MSTPLETASASDIGGDVDERADPVTADVAAERPRGRRAWSVETNDEVSRVLRLLQVRPWLVAGRDDTDIAAVRRNADTLRRTLTRLGWVLVVERDLVRLRKSPPVRRAAWAATAPSAATCSWFFLLVAAAEGQPPRPGLGQLVTAARAAAAEAGLPVTHGIAERRAIAAALRLLDDRGVLQRLDGDVDGFVHDENVAVLFAVHHSRLLHVIANFADADPVADPAGWLEKVEREPDADRRMRRRLVDDTLVHATDLDDAESDWLRRRVRGDDGAPLAAAFGLHVERRSEGAAFVVPTESFRFVRELGPLPFPTPGTVGHAALLLCDAAATDGALDPGRPGWRRLRVAEVVDRLRAWGQQFGGGRGGWAGEDVEDPVGLADKVAALLTGLDLVRLHPAADDPVERPAPAWWFSPAAGRWERTTAAAAARRTPPGTVDAEPAGPPAVLDLPDLFSAITPDRSEQP